MANFELARTLVATLPHGLPGLFNPWLDCSVDDTLINTPDAKLERLAHHLDCDPVCIGVGEAAGYLGMRHSALAFTSERLLLEGVIPRVPIPWGRLTTRPTPCSEPSATIVWKTLYRLGIAERTILWNAVALHPHHYGDGDSNRTPSSSEILLGAEALRILVGAFPAAKIVAIGRKAEKLLADMWIRIAGAVRHPANGGANEFAVGMTRLLAV